MSDDSTGSNRSGSSSSATPWIGLGLVVLVLAGAGVYFLLRPPPLPIAPEVMSDRLLTLGQDVYMDRCAICHGRTGLGDGPMSKGIVNPPVGDLTDGEWKHGNQPGEVVAVIRDGVKNTEMQAFGQALSDRQLKAVAAYVYHLSDQKIPDELRGR